MSGIPSNFGAMPPMVTMNGMNFVLVPQPIMDPSQMYFAAPFPHFSMAPFPLLPPQAPLPKEEEPALLAPEDLFPEELPSSPEVPSTPGSVCSPRSQTSEPHSAHTSPRPAADVPSPVHNEFTSPITGQNIKLYLKSAKSKTEAFVSEFPGSLLCQPYKYDIKIAGPQELVSQSLNMYLVYADTLAKPYTVKPSLKIMRDDAQDAERTIRFQMTLCSFHFGKRKFRLAIEFSDGDDSKPVSLFFSAPFHTFARKKNCEMPMSPPRPLAGTKRWRAPEDLSFPQAKRRRLEDTFPPAPQAPAPVQPLSSSDRTSAAISLLDSLTPDERQAVSMYLEITGLTGTF